MYLSDDYRVVALVPVTLRLEVVVEAEVLLDASDYELDTEDGSLSLTMYGADKACDEAYQSLRLSGAEYELEGSDADMCDTDFVVTDKDGNAVRVEDLPLTAVRD
jgi:uncharacterized glyoxalase superfamily protein PhnB